MMREIVKLVIGSALSPLILLIFVVIGELSYKAPDWAVDHGPNWTSTFSNFFRFVYPVSFVGVVAFGIPCYLLLRYFGHANYFALAGSGLVAGSALGALSAPILGSMLFYGGCGLLVATGFWFLSVYTPSKLENYKSPNKKMQPTQKTRG